MIRRRIPILVTLVVLLAAGLGVWRWRAAANGGKPQFETAAVERGRIVAKVNATGTLSAIVTVQVGSQVSGRIQALNADFNSPVKKGQLIAKIDPQLFEATEQQGRANVVAADGNLARAEAQALDAERQLRRARALASEKLIAQADLDTADANQQVAVAAVKAARGSLEQAKAAHHQAQVNLAYTDIISPTNGVVISRSVDVGQTVAASLQAPTLFVIAEDLAKMQVDTSVSEADVGRLRDAMDASFTVDAYPSETFQGKVRQIRNAPQTVQNVVTYDAVIDVENPELKLRPGMTANVTFVYAEKDDALRVPNAALRFRPPPGMIPGDPARSGAAPANGGATAIPVATGSPGPQPVRAASQVGSGPGGFAGGRRDVRDRSDRRTVWVLRDGKPSAVQIRTGISDGSTTEVREGALEPGDRVVTDVSGLPGAAPPAGGMPGAMRRPF